MKHLYYLFSLVAMLLGFASCNSVCGNEVYVPFKAKEGDRWGMLSTENGKILFENKFENEPSHTVNGLFIVKEGDSYSLYKAGSSPKLLRSGLCQVLHGTGNCKYLVASIEGESLFFMDEEGNTVKDVKDVVGKDVESVTVYSGGYFEAGDKIINSNLEVVKEFVGFLTFDNGWYIINGEDNRILAGRIGGEEVDLKKVNPEFDFYKRTKLSGSIVSVLDKGGKEGLIDISGKDGNNYQMYFLPKGLQLEDFNDSVYIYSSKKGWGVNDMKHNTVVPTVAPLQDIPHENIRFTDSGYEGKTSIYLYFFYNKSGKYVSSMSSETDPVSVGNIYITCTEFNCSLNMKEYYFKISKGEWTANEELTRPSDWNGEWVVAKTVSKIWSMGDEDDEY